MFLKNILLRDFRNYEGLDIDLVDGLNVFFGRNAQGKTNILESVYFCAMGKSHRGSPDAELIRWECQYAQASMQVQKENRLGSVEIRLLENGKKRVLVDGVPIKRLMQLMGALLVVLFSPEDLQLIKEGPSLRRRYMDTLLCQIKPSYFHDLQVYNRAVIQRNRMLQDRNTEAIDGFDVQLSQAGARIGASRIRLVELLQPLCAREHEQLSGGEELEMAYRPGMETLPEDVEGYFSILKESLKADLQRGFTTKGVHRDDILIRIGKTDVRRFASQGQQRSAALALRLGQCAAIENIAKERPVLLLDDVLSELDGDRVEHLLKNLGLRQVLLTCTSSVQGAARAFHVHNGDVTRA